ncbi:MAG: SDR family oxidoreductase [Rhodobacter sp.]|nr:SDR family oxidoreductase [Rhodobacter sp.]MBK8441607.1 SDR family oxidoreductase [Rhodobacter sp.]
MAWALITGASEGLGREFARLAAEDRHDLILTARRVDLLEVVAAEMRAEHGVAVEVIPADLAQQGEAARLWQVASAGREIKVLVNNAGLGSAGAFADPEDWAREYASVMVNVVSLTVLMKEAVTAMAAGSGGRVLNVASTAAFMPGPGMAVYHATKSYVLSLSEAVAHELRGSGVTVTALCPGATRTGFFRAADVEGGTMLQRLPMPPAEVVALKGWAAMKEGRRVAVTGVQNKLFAFLPRIAPKALVLRIAAQFLRRR